jgi:DNA sulfur modification protein DndD
MRIISLEMLNFRQFRGPHEIVFPSQKDRNVTVILGDNGSGKTTVLNAFIWAFFGEFTDDLQQQERIINDGIWAEAEEGSKVEAYCQVKFEHRNSTYTVKRAISREVGATSAQDGRADVELTLTEKQATGSSVELKNPTDVLEAILPPRLYRFFFFNGERIDRLADESAFQEIEEATKTLLGLEVLERAERHLNKVGETFDTELQSVGSTEQREVSEKLEAERARKESLASEKEEAQKEERAAEERRRKIGKQLKDLEEVKELQGRRERLEEDRRAAVEAKEEAAKDRDRTVASAGFHALLEPLAHGAEERLGALESKGELPAPYKESFIDELLETGECVCGRHLIAGEDPYESVVKYRAGGGVGETEEALIRIKAHTAYALEAKERVLEELGQTRNAEAQATSKEIQCEEELAEIARQFKGKSNTNIQKLEESYGQALLMGKEAYSRRVQIETQIEDCSSQCEQLDRRLQEAEVESEKAALAMRRSKVAHEAATGAQKIFTTLKDNVRSRLDSKVKETFTEISYKDREPAINEAFELTLFDTSDGKRRLPSVKSTGENQILSVSFVGGLASLAREFEEANQDGDQVEELVRGRGGIYPVVVDSPFGSLDTDYGRDVARLLPKLTPQTIILMSDKQASPEVLAELMPRINSAYAITYFTTKKGKDEDRVFAGREYAYRRSTEDGPERAEIVKLDFTGGANAK